MTVVKKRRRRKRGYKRGEYTSSKSGLVFKYRSGWELVYMKHLDVTDEVTSWSYETIIIPYVSNVKTGKMRKYYPDFHVRLKDKFDILVEIKPKKRVSQVRVQKKLKAAEEWCRAHDFTFSVITEVELKGLGLL